LRRLEPLVARAETVIAGHGGPIDATRAAAILREDLAYLDALEARGADAPLPIARRSGEQRRIHAENVKRLA
jgi:Ser/Thr protein kinase RdoA (MazF antagonist)